MGHHAIGDDETSLETLERLERMDDVMAIVPSAELRTYLGDAGAVETAIVRLNALELDTLEQRVLVQSACDSLVLSPFLYDVFAAESLDPQARDDLGALCEAGKRRGTN
jgi:hypothetical protein